MLSTIPQDVVADALASVFLAFLGGGGLWLRKQLKGVSQMSHDWNGEPARPGIADGTPGVMQRLYTQDKLFEEVLDRMGRQDTTLEEIRHEIHYNSGSSIKDAVHRTDDAIKQVQADMDAIKAKLEA